ncbi:MAG: coproporphyrinogen III oxidase [Betaproteobacteria bacterium]
MSYPSLDRFVEAIDAKTCDYWIGYRRIGGMARPLGVYAHVPGRGIVHSADGKSPPASRLPVGLGEYLAQLDREMALLALHLGPDRVIGRLIVGGRRATLLSERECSLLMRHIRAHFDFAHDIEQVIEIDPRHIGSGRFAMFAGLGFNRMSLRLSAGAGDAGGDGVDGRGFVSTSAAIASARACGFGPVSVELVYGAPQQTGSGFEQTLAEILISEVERIALHSQRDLPLVGSRARIDADDLPTREAEQELLLTAVARLEGAGYLCVGMDQFARPNDELAIAHSQGRLSRDTNGYHAGPECDLLGVGVATVGKIGPLYYQNMTEYDDYVRMLDHGRLPILRGVELTPDDLVRRAVIQALACQFMVSKESIAIAHLIDFDRYFAVELRELERFAIDGIVTVGGDWIQVTPRGRLLVRAVCAVFDRYLRQATERSSFESPP